MINEARLKNQLLELLVIGSHSRSEREIAQRLKTIMEKLGASVEIDNAGEFVGGNTGNVICRIPATDPELPAFFLSSHMDTVSPGEGVKPVIENDIVRTDGTTILGGDDKSGIAIIIEIVQVLQENNILHGGIEIAFTICEEVGLLGAKFLDVSGFKSKIGLVLDSEDVAYFITNTSANVHMEWTINGLAAHAGLAPQEGISSIQIASEAIAGMKQGRIDFETTANIGSILGGGPINVVPDRCVVKAEARSLNIEKLEAQTRHMDQCFKQAAARYSVELDGVLYKASVDSKFFRNYEIMDVPDSAPIAQLIYAAAANLKFEIAPDRMMGGCDANVLNLKGLQTVSIGTGSKAIHTVNETLSLPDLYQAARLVLEIVTLNSKVKVA